MLAVALSFSAATQPSAAATWPASIAKLRPIELSALIVAAMPDSNRPLTWEALQGGEVIWTTNGVEYQRRGARREGLARVRVASRTSTVLRRTKDELAWTVSLSSDGNPKFGPDRVHIEPGIEIQGGCFGTTFGGCSFTAAEALGQLRRRQICSLGPYSDYTAVFVVESGSKRGAVAYVRTVGSGGESAWINVYPVDKAAGICAAKR